VTIIEIALFGLMAFGVALLLLFLILAILMISDFLKQRKLKRNIPTDPKELAKPPINTNSEKEVKEDERRKFGKFREFEKLRRYASNPTSTASKPANGVKQSEADFILSSKETAKPRDDNSEFELFDPTN
jgi:Na+-transporting methylmalonyl-CoA/oxaloacetate decarboxylase gamma subunit